MRKTARTMWRKYPCDDDHAMPHGHVLLAVQLQAPMPILSDATPGSPARCP